MRSLFTALLVATGLAGMQPVPAAAEQKGVAIFAGGTGGHVYPALAVATELDRRGYSVHWFGTGRGLESRVVPAAGYPLHQLAADDALAQQDLPYAVFHFRPFAWHRRGLTSPTGFWA